MALLAKRRLKNLLLFVPNMIRLSIALLGDPRVPRTEKALVAAAVVYAIIPLDLIPDMIPFVGQVDDLYLIALTLLRLMQRTDPQVVRAHWNGGGDVVDFIGAAALLAGRFLPPPIRRVLSARVDVVPNPERRLQKLSGPLLVASEHQQGAKS